MGDSPGGLAVSLSPPPLEPPGGPNTTSAAAAACGPAGPLEPGRSLGTSLAFMLLGTGSNLAALLVVGRLYRRFRSRSRASFLVFAGGLVFTDMSGQVITGALVARAYGAGLRWEEIDDGAGSLCRFFGTCMVFFGLAPLALGTAMAAERCVGVSLPLRFAARVTARGARRAVLAAWAAVLALAALPALGAGAYVRHFPGSWCFVDMRGQAGGGGRAGGSGWPALVSALLFSAVGLACLAASLVCNTVTVVNLARARRRLWCGERRTSVTSARRPHDVEMAVQLVAIMLVATVCWSPFLVTVAMMAWRYFWEPEPAPDCVFLRSADKERFLLLLRFACSNQVLDPWVYILLRRAVLRALCGLLGRRLPSPHKMGSLLSSLRRSLSTEPAHRSSTRSPRSPPRGAGCPPSESLWGYGGPGPRHRATTAMVVNPELLEVDEEEVVEGEKKEEGTIEPPQPGSPGARGMGGPKQEELGAHPGQVPPAQGTPGATPGTCRDEEAVGRGSR
ncbi:thromboxane A2 receptor-like [Lethenteron reissneri]|uniref:thromboxane A2 receptor-like n=1 Tax=Lethenteron reissneri TaxID=7753 RepID=UPI002AB64ACF|nr:thromboxane A2 receptor-like [Lethenteron reissneri]XP_061413881.1 thromboxane A2 receptor-like [Lethenteron reissneri]XP_061413882.1 thromboxane A2 receptor-like [Lethenteron reissneri]